MQNPDLLSVVRAVPSRELSGPRASTRSCEAHDDPADEGRRRVPRRGHYSETARLERLEWLRARVGSPLLPLQAMRLNPERLRGNVENLVAAVEVPVGIVGPLLVHGEHARGWCYAPFATTEGALVASAVRGSLALSRSGGVETRVLAQRMVRAPVFDLASLDEATVFAGWLAARLAELRRAVSEVSHHALLQAVEPVVAGTSVFTRFWYETGDAAGQNMTTACTARACEWVMARSGEEIGVRVRRFLIESNLSGDKKAAHGSSSLGRGLRVTASALVRRDVLERVLDTSAAELVAVNQLAILGSIQAGAVGHSVNVANVVAAMFTATGQDIACVHESSVALLDVRDESGDLRISLVLPNLVVGTVGGGTHLPAQRAMLAVLGCEGPGTVKRLGELVAAFALALELSTGSAVASGAFAAAHERLGRNRPVAPLRREDLGARFLEEKLRAAVGGRSLTVTDVRWRAMAQEHSLLASVTPGSEQRPVGVHQVQVRFVSDGAPAGAALSLALKVKPRDEEVLQAIGRAALGCSRALAAAWNAHRHESPFAGAHLRELAVYQQEHVAFRENLPRVLFTHRDDRREAYVIALEDLSAAKLIDAVEDVGAWTTSRIDAVLRGLAELHAVWLGREAELSRAAWLGAAPTAARMAGMTDLWVALAELAAVHHPDLVDHAGLARRRRMIDDIGAWWPRLEAMPRTLVHNDFNPRNVALVEAEDGALRLKAFDWELATVHVPQYDLAEFLAHARTPDLTGDELEHFVELHRTRLAALSGVALDRDAWWTGLALALREFVIHRLGLTIACHGLRSQAYVARVVATTARLQELLGDA